MMLLKSCPKCKDMYGRYVKCLQCGLIRDIAEEHRPYVPRREAPYEVKAS